MAVIKNANFENKDDILELIDKFDKSSLVELEISITTTIPVGKETSIKMTKTPDGVNHDFKDYKDFDDISDISDISKENTQNTQTIKITKQEKQEKPEKPENSGRTINAPLIGTFYSSPSPDAEPYVKVGDKIIKGATVCVIEAMKIMNEIESETDGEIAEILVNNGDVVEFGEPLFRVK